MRHNWCTAEVTAIGSSVVVVRLRNQVTLYAQPPAVHLKVGDKVNIEVSRDNFWWSDIDPKTPPPTFVAEIRSVC